MEAASWKNDNTFVSFYLRDFAQMGVFNFCRSICSWSESSYNNHMTLFGEYTPPILTLLLQPEQYKG